MSGWLDLAYIEGIEYLCYEFNSHYSEIMSQYKQFRAIMIVCTYMYYFYNGVTMNKTCHNNVMFGET